jgi:pentatricopeptide repeat protein
MRACGQEGKVDKALELLRELQAHGEVDTVTYNCALDICVSCGKDAHQAYVVLTIWVLGALKDWLRVRTGSIVPSMIAHMIWNSFISLIVLFY